MRSATPARRGSRSSDLGEADFHIIQARGDHVVAVRAEETDIQISTDGGSRSRRARRRTCRSTSRSIPRTRAHGRRDRAGHLQLDDEGRSWRPRDPIPSEQLAWVAPDELYRSDPGGLIKVSADGGATWKDRGNVGLSVNELVADEEGALYASVPGGEVHRSTDGGAELEAACYGWSRSFWADARRSPTSIAAGRMPLVLALSV